MIIYLIKIPTWLVTSILFGLYVVIPFVPTEKILLYLKNRNTLNPFMPQI